MAEAARREALEAGLAAYSQGDFFLAHELLEPAWMGAEDLAERELLQGLIKLAAAYVHAVRRNPAGTRKNLRGALDRLEAGVDAGARLRIDAVALAAALRARLVAADPGDPAPINRPPAIPRPNEPG